MHTVLYHLSLCLISLFWLVVYASDTKNDLYCHGLSLALQITFVRVPSPHDLGMRPMSENPTH